MIPTLKEVFLGSENTRKRVIRFVYENHKGEVGVRTVMPISIYYGVCEPWHPEEGLLLLALDLDKVDSRTFAMNKIRTPPSQWGSSAWCVGTDIDSVLPDTGQEARV